MRDFMGVSFRREHWGHTGSPGAGERRGEAQTTDYEDKLSLGKKPIALWNS